MARPVRIHIPGALYLLQIRARSDAELFVSDEERALFLASVGEAAESYAVTGYAYALLPKSVLLFVRAGALPLSKFVHRAQAGYINRLKALNFRDLPRIRDRHRSILIEEGPLFVQVLCRVHLAPIIGGHWSNESEARRLGEILRTRWTSLPIYSDQEPPPAWFNSREAVRHLSHFQPGRPDESVFWYIMQEAKRVGDNEDVLDRVRAMSLLGCDEFVRLHYDRARGRTGAGRNGGAVADGQSPAVARRKFNMLLRLIARRYDVEPKDLLKARARHDGRKLLVELAMRHALGPGGVKEIGRWMNISGGALAHMRKHVRRRLLNDPEFARTLNRLEQEFLGDPVARSR
ncbi:MAG: hypothetical protein MAG453_00069 [Calditrichaeota bacterium]|nr:hypothetical protein [Calditrichota bacterium]